MAYIFPALCVIKLQNDRLLCWKNLPRILLAVFGLLVAVIGFIMVCIEIAHGVTCSHGEEMEYCYLSPSRPGVPGAVNHSAMWTAAVNTPAPASLPFTPANSSILAH